MESSGLDGSDDTTYAESDTLSENNCEDDLVAVMMIFWVSMLNKLYYGC
jgi:hypothetical protein